jgi:predicted nucleic acid-binding protein
VIILDTNVVSELMKPAPDVSVRGWLAGLGETPLMTTAVTVAEIQFGLSRLPEGRRKADLQARFEAFAGALGVLPLDEPAARETGRLRAVREAAGLPSQPSDMMIAGIAAVAGAALASRNAKDFGALPIEVLDPWRRR